jgi:tetratricopeptide (TPR) repeat protein
MREHAAWYKAYIHESRGDHHARYNQYAEAAAAHDQAIAEVDGVLPETYAYFTGLLNYTASLYFKANDFEHSAQRYQRFMDISVRKSEIGVEDPVFYRGWMRLATNLYLAKRTDEAVVAIERAARQENMAEDVELAERLLRLRLQGKIYVAAHIFDKAQAVFQEEINLASTQTSSYGQRTFEARVQLATVLLAMKDNSRFETAFEPLAKEITTRFGESNALARSCNQMLGMYYYHNENLPKARHWLESAFRGHRELFDSAVQAVREDEEAKIILASLVDIYMKQNVVPSNFLEQVKAGETSLDDLPFRETLIGDLSMPASKISPVQWEKLLAR